MTATMKMASSTETRNEIPLRQLHISTSKDNGGTDRYSVQMAAQMQAHGDDVVYACRPGGFTESQCRNRNIPVRPLRIYNSGDIMAAFRIASLARAERAQIIHVHRRADFMMVALGIAIARPWFRRRHLPRPVLILHSHVMRPLGGLQRSAGWFFRKTADAVLTVSQAGREYIQERHALPPDFVRLLLNGIPLSEYATPGSPQAQQWRVSLRKEWQIPENAFLIGMVGRLGQKGQEIALEILPRLLAIEPNLYLALVGPETDAKGIRVHKERTGEDILGDIEQYRARATELSVSERVILTGPRDDIPVVMASLDLFVHLPRDEAFGLVLAEAMASGLPLVVSRAGGCEEVAEENVTALFTPPGDADATFRAIASLLGSAGAPTRTRFREAGPKIAARFALETQTEALRDIYRELIQNRELIQK